MTDLTPAVWREIERQSLDLVRGDKHIGLKTLREILRKSRRSGEQNRLLWALYSDALQQGGETLGGWTSEDIHEFMLGEYYGWQVHEALGRKRMKPVKRSSRLTKSEFSDFLEFVVRKFAEHGIVLELPGEVAA